MKWMIPEEKLSSEQRNVMKQVNQTGNKPIWIQGHAGSGKSIVMLYALSDYLIRNQNANVAVVVFTHALRDLLENGLKQVPSLRNRHIPVLTIYQMKYRNNSYDAIFCDEVQDLPIKFINDLKAKCTQLLLAGDAAQSIYEEDPMYRLPTASVTDINDALAPKSFMLNQVFRLSQNILNILKNVYSSLNLKAHIGKENTAIRLVEAESYDEEVRFVWDEVKMTNSNRQSEVSAIMMFKRKDIVTFVNKVLEIEGAPIWQEEKVEKYGREHTNFESLNMYLEKNNIPLMYVGNKDGSLEVADKQNKIMIMTYHSSKGLDFGSVALPQTNTNLFPTSNPEALILVALSRSKKDLLISYTDCMDDVIERFLTNTPVKKIANINNIDDSDEILF